MGKTPFCLIFAAAAVILASCAGGEPAVPDVKKLEAQRAAIEDKICALNEKIELAKEERKKFANLAELMSGEKPPSAPAIETDDEKRLKEEQAKLREVMDQLSEVYHSYKETSEEQERTMRFAEAKRLCAGNLDAGAEDLRAMRLSLSSFRSSDPQYQEAQRLLSYLDGKLEAKDRETKKKSEDVQKKRFEAETASLSERGKKIKREHPDWTVEECDLISCGKIQTGMIEEQVRVALGAPFEVKNTGSRSKWIYGENSFACVYFEEGVCVMIQQ